MSAWRRWLEAVGAPATAFLIVAALLAGTLTIGNAVSARDDRLARARVATLAQSGFFDRVLTPEEKAGLSPALRRVWLHAPRGIEMRGVVQAPAVTYNPQPIVFGSVKLGATSAMLSSTLRNSGPDTLRFCGPPGTALPPGCVGKSSMTGSTAFQYVTDNCTLRPPGTSCVLQYRFRPTQVGPVTGANVIQTTKGPFPLTFTGTGLDTVTAPPAPVVAYVLVSPPAVGVYQGLTYQLQATVHDSTTARLPIPVTWSSSTPALATVDSTGLVTARTVGLDTIRATAQGRTGIALFTIVPPQPPAPPPVALKAGVFLSTLARFGITATPGTYGPWPIYANDSTGQIVGSFVVVVSIP